MLNEKKLYELTNPQKSIWNTEFYYKGSNINNICGTAIIKEVLNFDLLEKAINIVIKNNDSFQLCFTLKDSNVMQYLGEYKPVDIELISVNSKDDVKNIEDNLMSHVFEVLNSCLFTFKMFKFKDNSGGFMLNIHHLIADSLTLGILSNTIVKTYYDLFTKKYEETAHYSYIDFISSEKKYLDSSRFLKDKEYWDMTFKTIPDPVTLPPFKSNLKADFSCVAKREIFTLNSNLIDKISNYCNKFNISVFNFLFAIYSIYIGRVNNSDDFILGTPILNRTNYKEKHTTGMFVSTVPVRVSLTDSLDFSDFVKDLASSFTSIYRHQKYSYQHILQNLRKLDNSLPSLYNVLLSYQITNANAENSLEYTTDWAFNGSTADDLDVHFYDINNSGTLDVAYDFKTSKYSSENIYDMHNRILFMINQVLENNEIAIKDVSITTKNELSEILNNFNNTLANYPVDKTIFELFEEQVVSTPNNVAIKINNDFLTYDELNKKANQLANYLRNLSIKANDVIALRLNKSLDMIVAIFAILKSGACYLPIDLSYPQERVNFMLKDSNAKLFITNTLHTNDLSITLKKIELDSLFKSSLLSDLSNNNLLSVNNPDDLIYIIYTSGSTGTPKGVMLTHRNVVRLIKNDQFLFDFNSSDVWTMFHSVAFDFSVWEMYGCLLYGGKLILVPEQTAKDPNLFLELLRNEHVTVLNQTPTYFYNLLDMELLKSDASLSVRYIIYGGEALKPILIRPWKEKYPFTKLINMYGITETTVHVTFKELNDVDLSLPYSNIGKPIPTLKVYVMDKNLNILPYGVEGEMCVAGLGVCKGYLNRPELNSTRFEKNPYNPDEILYHSADTAMLSKDGNLFYIGRIDNQVKIRGFRVELGEIESKFLRHPDILKCVVLPKKNTDKDSCLVAYIVSNKDLSSAELKEYISSLVPEYMIPSFFIKLDDIPLTNNGKIDRKFLLNMKLEIDNKTTFVAPRNSFEKDFLNVLENTLCLENIGIDDNILELGADSLTLMKITISLLERNYIVNIQDIYEYKTVRLICDKINNENITLDIDNSINENIYYNFDENFESKKISIKNILLTGSTGYLGIHILSYLLENTDSTIYCLIRNKNSLKSKDRLIRKLSFYFGENILNYMDIRIKIITSDITDKHFGLTSNDYENLGKTIDVVIHSAAIVSHYGNKDLFNTINVVGTNNIIDFCKEFNIKMNHISTTSIAANTVPNSDKSFIFDEHSLYIGQNYKDNIYIKSKFEAEYSIWNAMNSGLDASIYRLGNITARFVDGKFQENDTQNAFLNRIVSFSKIKKIPESFANLTIDLSPVDECSCTISNLLQYESSYRKVFHIFNNNSIRVLDLLHILRNLNINIDILPDKEFYNYIATAKIENGLLGIINDLTSDISKYNSNITISSNFTLKYMKNLNLKWDKLTEDYIKVFLEKYIKKEI